MTQKHIIIFYTFSWCSEKHLASFNSLYGHDTPVHSYNATFPSLSPVYRHNKVWIHNISIVVADRIKSEEERIPTYTSLWRHWLRTCWVTNLWILRLRFDCIAYVGSE